VLVVGNKADLVEEHDHDGQEGNLIDVDGQSLPPHTPSSVSSKQSFFPSSIGTSYDASSSIRSSNLGVGAQLRASTAPEGREVTLEEASEWARKNDIPVAVEVSALSGENVDEVFQRLARMILTKIELGEIDPDDPNSGIQYGDSGYGWGDDGGSVKSGFTADGTRRRRGGGGGWGVGGLREWEEVFTLTKGARRRGGCC
jgi:GTPase SAR1 family protein